MFNIVVSISALALILLSVCVSVPVHSQGFPSKPVRLVCPYAPGGATDIISRAIAIELTRNLGQPVTVENRPGAGANLGAEQVARSAPDGYTLLMGGGSLHCITPALYTRLNYDPNKDLAPVSALAGFSNVLVVNPGLKANSVKDLIALAKAQPGGLSYASSGSGSTIHMSGEMFKYLTGVDMLHIPYKGSGPAVADLIGGQVNLMFDNIPSSMPHIRSGKLRALATTGSVRSPALPDLPTIAEAGVAGYESTGWFGLSVAAGTPPEILAKLGAESARGARSPEFARRMTDLGFEIIASTPEQMAGMIKVEVKRWAPVVRASGAKVD
jgi:tripartite-type tricarboxylate transporter receptor subunit TctC